MKKPPIVSYHGRPPQGQPFVTINQQVKQAFAFFNQGRLQEAHAICARVLATDPKHFDTLQLMGAIAAATGNFSAAVQLYTLALQVSPQDAHSLRNRGMALERLSQTSAALEDYVKAIGIDPNFAEAQYSLANLYSSLDAYGKAFQHYEIAARLNPQLPYVHGSRLMARLKISSWNGIEAEIAHLQNLIARNERASPPFAISALSDSPEIHRQAAQTWVRHEYPPNHSLGPISRTLNVEKIRIGYFSSDFRNHPVSYLAAELFELHNRDRFEVFAFSLVSSEKDEMQERLQLSFDNFIHVHDKSDGQVAQLARELKIDIAVDLGGFTTNNRFGIFSFRAAPIQVGYLGYLGTTGASYIDYIFADEIIIPHSAQSYYSEKIAYLPTYQVNDSKSRILGRNISREELGLPATGFVFCCMNSIYKIGPETFDSWMRILEKCDGSVLLLSADDHDAEANIKKMAVLRGIDEGRLIFAPRMARPEYLARYKTADLFLDTWPYNAGTTASDALWAGLPVLTLAGKSFASRVAASLLTAVGLPELISNSREQYEALAIELAINPQKLQNIAMKLALNHKTAPLFDTPLSTKNIEAAYAEMVERYIAQRPLDHIYIRSA